MEEPIKPDKNRLSAVWRVVIVSGVVVFAIAALLAMNARRPSSPLLDALRVSSTPKNSIHRYVPSVKQTLAGETFAVPMSVHQVEMIADRYCLPPDWFKSNMTGMVSYNAKEPNRIDFVAVSSDTEGNASPNEVTIVNIQYRRTTIDKVIDWFHRLIP